MAKKNKKINPSWFLVVLLVLIMLAAFRENHYLSALASFILCLIALPNKYTKDFFNNFFSKKKGLKFLTILTLIIISATGIDGTRNNDNAIKEIPRKANYPTSTTTEEAITSEPTAISDEYILSLLAEVEDFNLNEVANYKDKAYVIINDNKPFFKEEDLITTAFEYYSNLDELGRCSTAIANIGKDLMPTEDRENINSVTPTAWHSIKYKNIAGGYLYNHCHLIGFQLTGENANEKNIITGTRFLNIEGMLPFENMVADYIKETANHVLYRITPVFEGDNLLAGGVLMEAESVEDSGKDILFCIYCYNVEPGIEIDYKTGDSKEIITTPVPVATSGNKQALPANNQENTSSESYIGNKNSMKFHHSWCSSVDKMKESNKVFLSSREEAINLGYVPCKRCNP